MLAQLRKYPLTIAAILLAVVLNVYLYLHERIAQFLQGEKSKLTEACPDPSATVTRQNPNKTLFISCGGFLE